MIDVIQGDLVPTTADMGADGLRERMATDGYLLLPGLLDAERVRAARERILAICARAGWLDPAGPEPDTVLPAAACEPPDPRYYEVYEQVISLQAVNELPHAEPLLRIMSTLLDDADVLPRPASLARLVFPQGEVGATPPHQDFPHEQGTVDAYTAWVPLGDVPRRLGSLAFWPGSHRTGVLEHGFVAGVGGLGVTASTADARWCTTDYRLGDVVVFHSLTVHGALPNRTPDRLRISADFRFQRAGDPLAPHMLQPSGGRLTWDQVYADWTNDDLKYYWTGRALATVPYDRSYYQKRDREAIQRAREGDPYARSFLGTISVRNPDEDVRRAARELLAELSDGSPAGPSEQPGHRGGRP